jgi:MHS family citrate/tricarballylate:H+ symporter-like MFS transporter
MEAEVTSLPAHKQSKVGMVLLVTRGNFLGMFDFFLFGFYATYIAETFFPSKEAVSSLLFTFMTFGAGFLMRPLGAIVLGAYIDRVGRRKGLIVTLGIMACGTVMIAVVPGYAQIGMAAPLLVLIGALAAGLLRRCGIGRRFGLSRRPGSSRPPVTGLHADGG